MMASQLGTRWKKIRHASTLASVIAACSFLAAIAFVFITVKGKSEYTITYWDLWPAYIWAGVFLISFPLGPSLRTRSSLVAYRELIPHERRIEVIARITGEKPHLTAARIAIFIRQGKLDALYVDTTRGLVVVTAEEDDAHRDASSATISSISQPSAKVRTVCPGCGAVVALAPGQTAECDYCGATIVGRNENGGQAS